ncbi:hypothetical protein NHQ30_005276 [Ciborinia camelliae]|nr:hypothetical protein NHQ30_005276 [Ciborinia camelliae]
MGDANHHMEAEEPFSIETEPLVMVSLINHTHIDGTFCTESAAIIASIMSSVTVMTEGARLATVRNLINSGGESTNGGDDRKHAGRSIGQ